MRDRLVESCGRFFVDEREGMILDFRLPENWIKSVVDRESCILEEPQSGITCEQEVELEQRRVVPEVSAEVPVQEFVLA
jgi:hypothetical protein